MEGFLKLVNEMFRSVLDVYERSRGNISAQELWKELCGPHLFYGTILQDEGQGGNFGRRLMITLNLSLGFIHRRICNRAKELMKS